MKAAVLLSLILSSSLALAQHAEAQPEPMDPPPGAPGAASDTAETASPGHEGTTPTTDQAIEQHAAPPALQGATEQGAPHGTEHAQAEHAPAAGAHGDDDVPGYILHHVSDSNEYEIEIPLTHNAIPIHLPRILVSLKGNACHGAPGSDHLPALFVSTDPNIPLHQPGLGEGCVDLSITKHVAMMWLSALILLVLFMGAHRDKSKLVPHGKTANLLEALVVFVRDELAIKNIGKEYGPRFTPFLLTAFFFILIMNLLGLVPFMATATSNLAITAGLALCTFFVTQYAAIRAAGLGTYLAHLTGGVHWALWPIMVPVEVLGLFTKPFALTVRLFANMIAGHIVIFFLLGLIFLLKHPALALVSVPFALGIYLLELFVAFVQAYVFTMLSALFIGMGVAMAHHHHDDHGHDHPEGHAHDHGKAHHASGA